MIISNSVKVATLFVQLQCICVAFNLQSRVVKHESFATFQTSSLSSTPAKLGRTATRISMNPDYSLEASSSSPSNSGDKSDGTRREFFNSIMASGIGIMAGASASLANPEPANAQTQSAYIASEMTGGKKLGGLPKKIRNVGNVMDELQRDLMQERWDLVEKYPEQLRSYVPIFTAFTDSAFPSDASTDAGLRVALRYEVGRFFGSVERLKQATARKSLDEAYVAYSDMSLHFDRYLHVGGLYTYYDANVTNEEFFKGVSSDSLVYSDPKKDPADVRDLIILSKGPDMGKTGILIGIYPDGSNKCVVKLDRFMGLREIRVVSRDIVAKRLGEQDPDDVFLIPRKDEKS